MILDETPRAAFARYLQRCADVGGSEALIRREATEIITHLRRSSSERDIVGPGILERRWYEALAAGTPDWTIYDGDFYLAELWACWIAYSRNYLRAIRSPRAYPPGGIVADIGDARRIVDLGCGVGYTTAALCELFPSAEVFGTNITGATQTKLAESLGAEYGFRVVPTVKRIAAPVDLVFASEYFEHFENPIDHLAEVIRALRPRALLIANTFGSRSSGHFNLYSISNRPTPGASVPRLFSRALHNLGYSKIETRLWNSRPTYWKQV